MENIFFKKTFLFIHNLWKTFPSSSKLTIDWKKRKIYKFRAYLGNFQHWQSIFNKKNWGIFRLTPFTRMSITSFKFIRLSSLSPFSASTGREENFGVCHVKIRSVLKKLQAKTILTDDQCHLLYGAGFFRFTMRGSIYFIIIS